MQTFYPKLHKPIIIDQTEIYSFASIHNDLSSNVNRSIINKSNTSDFEFNKYVTLKKELRYQSIAKKKNIIFITNNLADIANKLKK
jgi:hypothetical protein